MAKTDQIPFRTRFMVPKKLLGPPTNSSRRLLRRPLNLPNASSPIVRLPTEIVLEIFSYAEPEDQLSLALTCKRLLQVSASATIHIPSAVEHRFQPFCRNMHNLLKRVMPHDAKGRPKRTVALCQDCLRYRPTRKGYWRGKKHEECEESEYLWERAVEDWNERFSTQCPECWCDENVAVVNGEVAANLKGRYDERMVDSCPCRGRKRGM